MADCKHSNTGTYTQNGKTYTYCKNCGVVVRVD